jgi:hypothetical protein
LLLTERAGRHRKCECARSKRNEKFSAIIHYLPLVAHYARLRQGLSARVFLTAPGYRSNDRLPNWKALLNFRFWPVAGIDAVQPSGR